ncbi:MAG: hypothetical protein DWQ10_01380 [Calditrichaeota bacterium]|nr:MAG: hypothetical protein DWQ10_01380 [Calditrichota bacterium]
MKTRTKLNLGCGTDIRDGYVNLDCAKIEGVDVIHSLENFPYPFEDNLFEEIIAINILEHIDDTIKTMEEIWRISQNNAKVIIRVPYWNSIDGITDPTHKKLFNQHSFEFFDPTKERCKKRPYYTVARFKISNEYYYIKFFKYFKVGNPLIKIIINYMSYLFGNVIRVLEYEMLAVKES